MPFTSHAERAPARRNRLAALAVAGATLAVLPAVPAAATTSIPETPPANAVNLRLVTAGAASVGDVVPVEVWADGLSGVAGFEIVATVSPDAGRIVAAASDDALGRTDLSIGDVTGFGVVAAYSPDGDDLDVDTARIGTFDVRLDAEGAVGIDLGAAMVVNAEGDEFAVNDVVPTAVQVGASSVQRPAPAMPWTLSSRDTGDTAALPDASELELEWQTTRLHRDPCAGDLAADAGGCLDIADVQRQSVSPSARTAPVLRAGPYRLTVNSRSDDSDRNIGNGVCATAGNVCSLRAAIQEANAIGGPNLIAFDIPGPGPFRIETSRRLPTMNDRSGRTIVNGYTQPNAAPNTARRMSNARILIEVVGVGATGHDGFAMRSGGNVLRGLSIYAFHRPVWIFRTGEGTPGNRILGSFIGTDPTGRYREPNEVDVGHGIHIEQGSPNTKIGGRKRASRNVISGNAYHGIGMWHSGTDGTVVRNNIIGLSPRGDRALKNWEHGIDMNFGVSGSRIGGRRANHRNVISGNDFNGVEMSHRAGTSNNRVVGNFIGTTLSGRTSTSWTANGGHAMWIEDGASKNIVSRNVMGGNRVGGIRIFNIGVNGVSSDNVVGHNWIGVSRRGEALPQGGWGIEVEGASNVIRDNEIANQDAGGVVVSGPDARSNTISRNSIHDNGGLAIDIAPIGVNDNDPGDADTGPNARLNFPEFTDVTARSATGTACAGCRVEVFVAGPEGGTDPRHGPALLYLGADVADQNGRFEVTFAELAGGTWLSSTATNPSGATSEMSANAQVPS